MRPILAAFVAALLASSLFSLGCASRLDETPIQPDPVMRGPLPEEVAKLGTPCPNPPEAGSFGVYSACGRDGHIGLVSLPKRTGMPGSAKRLEGSTGGVIVAIEENRVWVQSTCPMCRTFMETTTIADLQHATDDQLLGLQMSAELANKSPLRDAAAWEAAVAAWEPRR